MKVDHRKRSIVYVDGLNLYYGALKGTKNRWLDLQSYFVRLRQDDELEEIVYFTSAVRGKEQALRQKIYLDALSTSPKVSIVLGKFKYTEVYCGVRACSFSGTRQFRKPEEKRTDVNIAVRMVSDAYHRRCERMILVSGDSDLMPPLSLIRDEFPEIERIVYVPSSANPARGAATELRTVASKARSLPMELVARSQFPSSFESGAGQIFKRPEGW